MYDSTESESPNILNILENQTCPNLYPIEKIPETETDTSCSPGIIGVKGEAVPP